MVSFWPFGRRDDNSPDSFERVLAKLATQIQASSTQLALLRQRSRRYKALLTLYTVFGYILYAVLVVLLVGYQNLGPKEGAGLVGGPFGIYTLRRILDAYYFRRISYTELKLEALQSSQRETIEKLKSATKYSTTQSLIEKYGGITSNSAEKPQPPQQQQQPQREHRQPPPPVQTHPRPPTTPKRTLSNTTPQPLTPTQIQQNLVQQQLLAQQKAGIPPQYGSHRPESPPQPLQMQAQAQPSSIHHLQPEEATAPSWYDRLMDVIIGEDETSAKARYALICKNCRMVNGLAPPGTKDLSEMEEWGCARCGTMNGKKRKAGRRSSPKVKQEEESSEGEIFKDEDETEEEGVEEEEESEKEEVAVKPKKKKGGK